ncbi:MAG TPA: ABC transporter permease [Thermoanaerobaculia bacterium]|nr:ABC transporter permease [Thermoanaerobaculia bacterium]
MERTTTSNLESYSLLERFGRDLRFGLRSMARRPAVSIAVVLTLAVGISASATIFSFIDHLLLHDLPYPRSEELVAIWESQEGTAGEPQPVSESNFEDWESQSGVFTALGAFSPWLPTLRGTGEPERIVGMSVSAGYFEALAGRALIGRIITHEDDRGGHEQVVVLSHALWRRRFGADPSIVGRSVTLGETSYTILGVLQPWFRHPRPDYFDKVDVWRPLALAPDPAERGGRYLKVVGRVAPNVSLKQASVGMENLARSLAEKYPVSNRGWGVIVRPLREEFVGKMRPGLTALAGAAVLLFLIACINVANLLLSKMPTRSHEIGLRIALGADRRKLLSQLLAECWVLGLAGGALGLLLAAWEIKLLRTSLPPLAPGLLDVRVDGPVLGFALLLSFLAVALFGMLPSLQTLSPSVSGAIRDQAANASASRRSSSLMFALVAAEVALTLALLVAGGMLLQSFRALWRVDPGFRSERMLMLELSLRKSKYANPASLTAFLGELEARVKALPGVASATLISNAPFTTWNTANYFRPEGWSAPAPTPPPDAEYRVVSADFCQGMGLKLLQGRPFSRVDREGAPGVVIVNRALAERYWPGGRAVGERLTLDDPTQGHWLLVVGVVANVLGSGLGKEPKPTIYRPYAQAPQSFMSLMVRATQGEPEALAPSLRKTIAQADPDIAVANVQSVAGAIRDSLANERGRALVLALLALTATLLMAAGLYGVLSTAVSQRTREFGIRMAIGASEWKILGLALWRAGRVVILGIGIGIFLAFVATRLVRSLLYQVSPADPKILIICIFVELGVALVATLVPARRAAHIDPISALRRE